MSAKAPAIQLSATRNALTTRRHGTFIPVRCEDHAAWPVSDCRGFANLFKTRKRRSIWWRRGPAAPCTKSAELLNGVEDAAEGQLAGDYADGLSEASVALAVGITGTLSKRPLPRDRCRQSATTWWPRYVHS